MRIYSHTTVLPAAPLISNALARAVAAEHDAAAAAELARTYGTAQPSVLCLAPRSGLQPLTSRCIGVPHQHSRSA